MFKRFLLGLTTLTLLACVGCGNSETGTAKNDKVADTKNSYTVTYNDITNSTETDMLSVPLINTSDYNKAVLVTLKGTDISKNYVIKSNNYGDIQIGNDNISIDNYDEGVGTEGTEFTTYFSSYEASITFSKFYNFRMRISLISEKQYNTNFEEYKTKKGELLQEDEKSNGYTFYRLYDKDGTLAEYFALYGDASTNTYLYIGTSGSDTVLNKNFHDYVTAGNISVSSLEIDENNSIWNEKKFYKLTDEDKKYPIIHDCIADALRDSGIEINESKDIYRISNYGTKVKCEKTYNNKQMYYYIDLEAKDADYYKKQCDENSILKANEENGVYEVVSNSNDYNDFYLKTTTGRIFSLTYNCNEDSYYNYFKDANIINEKLTGVPFVEGKKE